MQRAFESGDASPGAAGAGNAVEYALQDDAPSRGGPPELVEHLDGAGRRLAISQSCADVFRQPPAEIIGTMFGQNAAPGCRTRIDEALDDWRRGVRRAVSYELLRADGSSVWLECEAAPFGIADGLLVRSRDVSEIKRLSDADALFREALGNMSQGLVMYDEDETLRLFNERYLEVYGLEPGALRAGMTLRDVVQACKAAGRFPGRSEEDVYTEQAQVLRGAQPAAFIDRVDESRLIKGVVKRMDRGGWVATFEDVTERQREHDRIVLMAHHDTLTRLANRDLLKKRFDLLLNSGAASGCQIAVLCLDLDRFKPVNDTLGHAAGDALLQQVADRFRGLTRPSDTVARTGGDEFIILQAEGVQPEGAAALAARLLEALRVPFNLDGRTVSIDASIGIALHPRDGAASEELIQNADLALYRAKTEGRGRYCFYDPAVGARRPDRQTMECDLRAAIGSSQIEMHYQPIVECSGGRVLGFEALMRWTHPLQGEISPEVFIPLAEEAGLIVTLGLWALGAACHEASTWPDRLKVSVNLSAAQFFAGDLHSHVTQILRRTGLLASRLELEITESLVITNTDQALTSLRALRAVGIGLALDDFGTGYSSLGYLQRFPFSRLKIDRSFVGALGRNAGADGIVEAILAMSRSLCLDVTAEGVETDEQLALLRRHGCDTIQGFLVSRPLPAGDIPAFLAQWLRRSVGSPLLEYARSTHCSPAPFIVSASAGS